MLGSFPPRREDQRQEAGKPGSSTQPLSLDLSNSPLDLFGFCHAEPVRGHVNWALATFTGTVSWEEWETDGPFRDSDYNLGLYRDDKAALTNLGNGLGLEFRSDETVDGFRSPHWEKIRNAVQVDHRDDEAHRLLDGPAVVTGLFGIDGVHGGYTELHPVYAFAVRIGTPDVGEEKWTFFLRNDGTEGNCSSFKHHWDGLDGAYSIRLPWPEHATGVSLVSEVTEVWGYKDEKVIPAVEQGGGQTYLQFTAGQRYEPRSLYTGRSPSGMHFPPKCRHHRRLLDHLRIS